jgi:hypothetical protein
VWASGVPKPTVIAGSFGSRVRFGSRRQRHRLQPAYSVEKLGSCELENFSMNQIGAESQPQIRGLTSYEQSSLEIVGSRWPFGPFKNQPF